jgi:hypothetical protein
VVGLTIFFSRKVKWHVVLNFFLSGPMDKNNKTPIDLAKQNEFENKFKIFKFINNNNIDQDKNTIVHKLVKDNKMTALRLLLEYASNNCFIDLIGFGLKNNENKTPFELAVDLNKSEAIFLLNHYELNDKLLNSSKYSSKKRLDKHFNQYKVKIELLLNINDLLDHERIDKSNNRIRNLIFEGGGVKGIAYIGSFRKSIEANIFKFEHIKRIHINLLSIGRIEHFSKLIYFCFSNCCYLFFTFL